MEPEREKKFKKLLEDLHLIIKEKVGDEVHFALFLYTEEGADKTVATSLAATVPQELLTQLMFQYLETVGALRVGDPDEDEDDGSMGVLQSGPTLN